MKNINYNEAVDTMKLRKTDYFTMIVTVLMLVAIPVTIYVANKPQEVQTNAAQVTTPRPQISPTLTPTPTAAR